MNPSTETIFLQAIEMPKGKRLRFLDGACEGDVTLRAAVEALLWADEHPELLTRSPVSNSLASAMAAAAESIDVGHGLEGPGSVIGNYKILEELGEGGFGRVFLAEQEFPVRRRVALKILKAGMDTRQIIGRFEAERQALAMMDHPGIAKVFDAGATSSGRPYFVMELVKGIPLTAYADQHSLTLRQRLGLFRDVCLAVQHAHGKGVIHRDIKPSNLLVVSGDSGPEPKVIDFGIAKASGARLSEKTVHTEASQWLGTPEYMSPEQAGSGQDVDTRSDIYSLGATLYELLIGVTPFDTLRLRSVSYDQVARMIREDEPPRPSTRLSRLGDDAGPLAEKRKTDSAKLAGTLRGDLDWIVMRAIDKDRSRRYDTSAALAADIQRFLDNKPVEARPPSTSYQLSKWVRRNRGAFAASVAIGAAIILGIVGLGAGLLRAADEARRAEQSAADARASALVATAAQADAEREAGSARQAEGVARAAESAARIAEDDALKAQSEAVESARREREAAAVAQDALRVAESQRRRASAVATFIQQDMLGSESDGPLAPGYTVRQMVENAERKLDAGAGELPPDFEAAIRHTIGLLFIRVADFARAEANLRRAVDVMEATPDEHGPGNYADAIDALGVVLNYLDRVEEAQEYHERALEVRLEHEPDKPDSLATSYANLAGDAADQRDFERAEELYRRALELRLGIAVRPDRDVGHTMLNLGMVVAETGRVEEGEGLLREAIRELEASAGDRSVVVGLAWSLLGEMLIDAERRDEAVEPLRLAVAIRAERLGSEHRYTISSRTLLGRAMRNVDPLGGLAELIEAATLAKRSLPIDDNYRFNAQQIVAMTLFQRGDFVQAEPWMREFEPVIRFHFPPRSRPIGGFLAAYGETLLQVGGADRLVDAERNLRECLDIRESAYTPRDPNFWLIEDSRAVLGQALAERGLLESADPAAADALLTEGEACLLRSINAMRPPAGSEGRRTRAIRRLVNLYEAWEARTPGRGIGDKAAPWREQLTEPPEEDGDG